MYVCGGEGKTTYSSIITSIEMGNESETHKISLQLSRLTLISLVFISILDYSMF